MWRHLLMAWALAFFFAQESFAKDLGFRFKAGICVNEQGVEGLNPGYFGQCGDLRRVRIERISFDGMDLSGSQFAHSSLQQTSFQDTALIGVNFNDADLSGTDLSRAQLMGASFQRAILKNIKLVEAAIEKTDFSQADFSGSALSYIAFKNSILHKAIFSQAQLDGADFSNAQLMESQFYESNLKGALFSGANLSSANLSLADLSNTQFIAAKATKANFSSSFGKMANFQTADLSGADLRRSMLEGALLVGTNLQNTDLRNANLLNTRLEEAVLNQAHFNAKSSLPITQQRAVELGMIYQNTPSVLILWDVQNDALKSFKSGLEKEGVEVTLSPEAESSFKGARDITQFDSIILLNGADEGRDMPLEGQKALIDYVNAGGKFFHSEWMSYKMGNGQMKMMRDLALFDRQTGNTTNVTMTTVDAQKGHPLLEGLSAGFVVASCGFSPSRLHTFETSPSTLLMNGNGMPMVATRNFGKGKIIGMALALNYQNRPIQDVMIQKLFINGIFW